jgi:hypothetical protein
VVNADQQSYTCTNTPVECDAPLACDPETGECADLCEGVECDDGNPCTDDACNAATGNCVHANNNAPCDDGDICTEDDVCSGGTCGGTPVDCDDGDACTEDSCDPATGCVTTPVECDDGDACNGVETCDPATGCVAGTPVDCDDGDLCTTDVCDPATGACTNDPVVCDEGFECDPDTGDCVESGCEVDADCDDEDACTDDACVDGECVNDPVECPQGEACNPASGECEEIACESNADCDDGVLCTTDTCNTVTGECIFANVDALCEDGLFCTGGDPIADVCDPADPDAGADGCVRGGNPCSNPTPICNEAQNSCVACTDAAQCNDDVPCTQDTCVAGSCNNNPVSANCPDPLKCDGVDYCDPFDPNADADGCVQPGDPCDPKLCVEADYVVGDPATCTDCTSNADCNDGIACTNDTCDGVSGTCFRVPDSTLCPDPLYCDGPDFCDPTNIYADAAGCVPPFSLPCAPEACREIENDECFLCTSNADCDDGIDCTDDFCDGVNGWCSYADNCEVGLSCNYNTGECE